MPNLVEVYNKDGSLLFSYKFENNNLVIKNKAGEEVKIDLDRFYHNMEKGWDGDYDDRFGNGKGDANYDHGPRTPTWFEKKWLKHSRQDEIDNMAQTNISKGHGDKPGSIKGLPTIPREADPPAEPVTEMHRLDWKGTPSGYFMWNDGANNQRKGTHRLGIDTGISVNGYGDLNLYRNYFDENGEIKNEHIDTNVTQSMLDKYVNRGQHSE
ncbi:MAG: hypothetical protein CMP61_07820 [Flavobacteriales bacterium]|nr:hypothetical protein [Flavobacteriales bacterium]|tara:strand:- start:22129 stop:22761 length:633 start_codon:yes stop_codon:yes gene_type:complete